MIDTLDPNDYVNFPNYLTHLDTNFQVEWITRLPYSETFGHRYTLKVTQLHDGNFITQQTAVVTTSTRYLAIGWAAKFDRLGNIIWNHFYLNDSFNHSYFYDVAERPDGGLVFIGYSYKNGIPASHEYYDMWLVGVDSNGCELPGGCSTNLWPAGTTSPVPSEGGVTVYPNPSTGKMTVRVPMEGVFMVHDLKGQLVREYRLGKGETEISLPSGIAPGVYFGRYVTEFGVETVRVIVNY